MVKGTSNSRARVSASKVLPEPVGPTSKILDLLVMSPWFTQSLTYFVFYITGALLLYGAIGILIGVPNYVPLLHGACVFHVGKPKTDR